MDNAPSEPDSKPDYSALQSENLQLFGLIGKTLTHSFSQQYFLKKFQEEELENHHYELFPLDDIDDIRLLLEVHKNMCGLNVTIPYKESVIPYLDELDPVAAQIGAVNCIHLNDFVKKGYNTDWMGFQDSLLPFLDKKHTKALILGSGGSSKAVQYALSNLGMDYTIVSRTAKKGQIQYAEIDKACISEHLLIINTSPVGMSPSVQDSPAIPMDFVGKNHICFDLIYNPTQTKFLQEAERKGAAAINGQRMLELQAEYAWNIWQSGSEGQED